MIEREKKYEIMDIVKDAVSYVSKIVSASVFPPITEGVERVMKTIENKMIRIEKRILRKIHIVWITTLGSILWIFALFFFFTEHLIWTKTAAFFVLGVIILTIGFLIRLWEFSI